MGDKKKLLSTKNSLKYLRWQKTYEPCIGTTHTLFKQIDNSCLLSCWPLAESGIFPYLAAALSAIQDF